MRRRLALSCVAVAMMVLGAGNYSSAEKKTGAAMSAGYDAVQIMQFEVKEGVEFPPEYAAALNDELGRELGRTKYIRMVLREGQTPGLGVRTLRIGGTITEFKPGNRAERYVVGMGTGQTKIVAQVRFIDATTGEVVWEDRMDGRVWAGAFGGQSMGAARGLAKEVAKKTTARFFGGK